jgi:hypothetical protein
VIHYWQLSSSIRGAVYIPKYYNPELVEKQPIKAGIYEDTIVLTIAKEYPASKESAGYSLIMNRYRQRAVGLPHFLNSGGSSRTTQLLK